MYAQPPNNNYVNSNIFEFRLLQLEDILLDYFASHASGEKPKE